MKKRVIIFVLLISSVCAFAQFKSASFMVNGENLPYQIMFPESYNESKQYPLVVFLHGSGERGSDNQKQLTHGKQFLIDNFYNGQYEAIVIVPQCPADSYWSNVVRHQIDSKMTLTFGLGDKPTKTMETLILLIENWMSSGKVDIKNVYAGGLSMGGMGTFELLWRMPHTFAAAFPICGGADINKLPLYAQNTAVWIFHGSDDSVVPVQFSRDIYTRLKELECDTKYTEYEGVNHNSWDNVFQEKALVPWLFSKHR